MDHDELPELPATNIHQALADATLETRSTGQMKNFSVRMPEAVKNQAQDICERNGTDLGTYLRHCAVALVQDYGAQQE